MADYDDQNVRSLEAWLAQRRWYGDKGRTIVAAEPVFRIEIGLKQLDLIVEVVQLSYAAGPPSSYLLLRRDGDRETDAIEAAAVRSWLLEGLLDERAVEGEESGRLRWRLIGTPEVISVASSGPSHVFGGEQSNSSIVFGDAAIMKIFRRIREGINPEVEIGEFLTRYTSFTAFPRLLGTIDLEQDDDVTTIAAVQEFIPSVGDAWIWVTSNLAEGSHQAEMVDAAHLLGVRTAEMHVAFATGRAERFLPEVASGAYAEAVRAEARAELEDTVDQLERRGVGGATMLGARLESALDALLELEGTMITRIHGDYHLGQVLRTTDDDFAILDFEGEPTRSLAERRAKASPLRDVAGMLRSFDYAAESARRTRGTPSNGAIGDWYEAARASFLDGYDSIARESSVLMRGWEQGARPAVLAALEIHKALYEVRYELSNRPDWLEIPLNALRRISADS